MNARRLQEQTIDTVSIVFDGKKIEVPAGISVAAAVLGHAHPRETYTNPVDGSPRVPYCLMGTCFECMMEINGEENVQSCMVTVQEGMVVKRQARAKVDSGEAEQ